MQAVCTVKVTVRLWSWGASCVHCEGYCSTSRTVQNTICGSANSCSPDDGHNDARNMLR